MIVSAIQRIFSLILDRQYMTIYRDYVDQETGKKYVKSELYSYTLYSKKAQIESTENNKIDVII